jgi:hypothetical protein
MSNPAHSIRATLDAWRAQRADRLDPVRFHFIDALERRAAAHGGAARRILDDRLAGLVAAYAEALQGAPAETGQADAVAAPGGSARGPLGVLADQLAARAVARGGEPAASDAPSGQVALPAAEVLDEFRRIWSQVRSESQLRQSLERLPANAGPLNSSTLVHRSIALMRELSPGYLEQFLAYLDDLSWLARMNPGTATITPEAPQPSVAKKRARARPRARRE